MRLTIIMFKFCLKSLCSLCSLVRIGVGLLIWFKVKEFTITFVGSGRIAYLIANPVTWVQLPEFAIFFRGNIDVAEVNQWFSLEWWAVF